MKEDLYATTTDGRWQTRGAPGYLVSMFLLLLACAEPTVEVPPRADPDASGPYGIGVQTLEFTDARGKDMVAEIWYPATVSPDSTPDPYPEIPITLNAHRKARADTRGAPYPLVAFSHGMGGIRYQSAFLCEFLASHGYVVVAMDHTHNTFLDMDESMSVQVLLERPGDVTYTVDEVYRLAQSEDPTFAGMVDPEAGYAMMGHSFGAWTSMVVGGGVLSLQSLVDYCAADHDSIACDYLAEVRDDSGQLDDAADPRVRTTLPLAPGVWYGFGDGGEGLREVVDPFVLGGDHDTVLPYDTEILPTYAAMAAPKQLGTLANAGHYAFSDICLIAAPLFDDCDEEAGGFINMERAHFITQTVITAKLDSAMLGASEAEAWLQPEWAEQNAPELRWESQP